jgi:magnesium chelatase subunit D
LQFRGTRATLLLPPTNSTDRALKFLTTMPTGGRTPLASGLRLALRTFQRAQARNKQWQAILVLVTDGRANVADLERTPVVALNPVEDAIAAAHELRAAGILSLVIDTEEGPVRTALASRLAQELGGACVPLATLEAAPVANAVRVALGRRGFHTACLAPTRAHPPHTTTPCHYISSGPLPRTSAPATSSGAGWPLDM